MAMVRRSSIDRMSSSMTSSITGAAGMSGMSGMGGIGTMSGGIMREMQNMTIGGMAANYTPGLSAHYNVSSFHHRPGLSRRPPNQKPGPTAQKRPGRSHSTGSLHRMKHSTRNSPNTQFSHSLISRMSDQNERRRRQETLELVPQSYYSQQPLKVELTEFYSRDNSKDHHTENYELVNDNILPNPVLRRGQNFFFAVRFDRTYDKQQDMIRIVFCFGSKPSVTKGTRVVLPVNWSSQHGAFQHSRDFQSMPGMQNMQRMQDMPNMATMGGITQGINQTSTYMRRSSFSNETVPIQHSPLSPHGPMDRVDRMSTLPHSTLSRGYGSRHGSMQNLAALAHEMDRWDLSVQRQDGNTITFQVHIPASAPVGVWHCWVQTNRQGQKDNRYDYKCDEDIYILFNPWCREDSVYMDNESYRKEYVMNDHGKVWCGTYRQPKGRKWIYGQFDDVVLPAISYLLERSGLEHSERGNPIRVVRAISSMINANEDDDGLMVGRYDGEYKDGVAPHAWTGTIAILERYLSDGGRPVEYGQCWVYSAAVVTICRALGIPCRSVTNYISAHDTNRTFTIDKYFDRDGNEVPNGPDEDCFDSCWNFHSWNDVWMQRPDLPQGYGGWQIIDSTPQEESESVYRCGPASVEAVRRGEVGFQYDTPFVYSEVNADLCHFQEEENSEWGFIRMSTNQYQVGRKIVTKNPNRDDDEGESDLLEITHEYKGADGAGSAAERLAVYSACRGLTRAQQYYEFPNRDGEDVYFDLMDIDMVPYGQPFDVTMNIQNKSHEDRNIYCVLTANSCYYTGAIASRLRRTQGDFVVRAGQREMLKLHVTPQDYMDKLVDHSMIKIYAMAYVRNTRQTWSEEDDFPLHKPRMQVQVRSTACIGQECGVTFSFQNPLTTQLTDCYFTFEGPGLQRPRQIRYRDVKPGEFVTYQEKFVPRRNGERKIVATFSSRQLDEIHGSCNVNVRG